MLTEQFRPQTDRQGHILTNENNIWEIKLQNKELAALSIQGPPGMQFAVNQTPKTKINMLNVGFMGAYELNEDDLSGLIITKILVYITPALAITCENNGWPIIVDVAYKYESSMNNIN